MRGRNRQLEQEIVSFEEHLDRLRRWLTSTVEARARPVPDLATCTATRHGTGPFTITRGAGIYRGITGGGHYVENGAAIGVRASNGSCKQRFKLNYAVAQLNGTATR